VSISSAIDTSQDGVADVDVGVDGVAPTLRLHPPGNRWSCRVESIAGVGEVRLLMEEHLREQVGPFLIQVDVIREEVRCPSAETLLEAQLLSTKGNISDPRPRVATQSPELLVQDLSDPVGPAGVVRNRRDDAKSGARGFVDGLDEDPGPVKDVLLRVPVVRPAEVVGTAGKDEVTRHSVQPLDFSAKERYPVVVESSPSTDVVKLRRRQVALSFVRMVLLDELVLTWDLAMGSQVAVAKPVL